MGAYKQNAVSSAIWRWTGDAERQRDDPRRRARRQAVIIAAVAVLLRWVLGQTLLPMLLLLVALASLVTGRWLPRAYLRSERWAKALGAALGRVVAWLVLAPFFYVFFTIGRCILAMRGRDPMNRAFPTDLDTYWSGCGRRDVSHVHKQY